VAKVLVTGAGGFVGHYLVPALISAGHEVTASVYAASPVLSKLLPPDRILQGDLTDYSYLEKCLETAQPQVIYHLAALSIVHTEVEANRRSLINNLSLQYNLLEGIRLHCPQVRLLAVCSGNIYGLVKKEEIPIKESNPIRPLNVYSVSKLAQEYLALQYHYAHNLDVVILRPFNHTGPGQSAQFVIPSFAKQFAQIKAGLKEPVIHAGSLTSARDFTDVEDMVQAYLLAAEKCRAGEIYNIGSGRAITLHDLLVLMQELTGQTVKLVEDPTRIRFADVPLLLSDTRKFREATGWKPQITLRQTLTKVLQYWEKQL